MVTLSTADNALKSFYLDAVSEALNTKINPFLAKIDKTSEHILGKDIRKPFTAGFNSGIGSGTEDGNLPAAHTRNYKQLVATLKNFYGTMEISDKAIRASAGSEGAFVNLLNEEMNSLINSAKFNFGRMLFGNGSGILGEVAEVENGVVTVSNVQNFVPGMVVDIVSEATTYEKMQVLAVDYANGKITVDTTGVASGFASMTSGNCYLHGSRGEELTGLDAIFNGTQLYGLVKADEGMTPYIKNSVGDITEEEIQKAMDSVEAATGTRPNFIICSWGVRRALQAYYKQYNMALPTMEVEGVTALNFNGVPVIVDRFCPEGTMYLLNTDCFKLYQLCDWQWLESEDGKILKQVAGKPVYTATLVKYAELLCENPAAQAMLTGITVA